ncbi:MAG TPA: flagellar biosynthetic protein FliO [Bryobacteraceae bacterium]|nr:flagellar biosynthetic protein FliO [Bryobacteraceae bacterium]
MDVLRQVCSVLLVFLLLGALVWALRRGGRGQVFGAGLIRKRVQEASRAMIAMERLALTPHHTLHIVRVNGREVLVATHPQGCSLIAPAEPAERSLGARA